MCQAIFVKLYSIVLASFIALQKMASKAQEDGTSFKMSFRSHCLKFATTPEIIGK
jgi:hypothetical protein